MWAKLGRAQLAGADLTDCNLTGADLHRADMKGINLTIANLTSANLDGAQLQSAKLERAILVETTLTGADITGSNVYGASVWGVKTDGKTRQTGLIVTPSSDPPIMVDDVEVAQFIYLLLENRKIRGIIDTITSKAVLILGRFSEERKPILDALHAALRDDFKLVPIMFDFQPSRARDLTETVQLLANLCRFVIADLTDAKSIPQELSHIVPFLPSVPMFYQSSHTKTRNTCWRASRLVSSDRFSSGKKRPTRPPLRNVCYETKSSKKTPRSLR